MITTLYYIAEKLLLIFEDQNSLFGWHVFITGGDVMTNYITMLEYLWNGQILDRKSESGRSHLWPFISAYLHRNELGFHKTTLTHTHSKQNYIEVRTISRVPPSLPY